MIFRASDAEEPNRFKIGPREEGTEISSPIRTQTDTTMVSISVCILHAKELQASTSST